MSKIRILPQSIVGKIAAGEVIERPASALKELIENSIDAKSKNIKVYIKEYGIALIKVIDDGEGIPSEDILLAFHRHATSKIEKEDDLSEIKTLGFRGEALYSIAQISKLRIISQYRGENLGKNIYLESGKLIEQKPALTKGTTVEIRELFFNTPVRKKFLKSPHTEKSHIIEIVQNYALSYPEISFYLNIDEEEVLVLPETDSILSRIAQIFSYEFTDRLIIKKISTVKYTFELFWGKEELMRRQRTKQLIFINRRPVRDIMIASNLYKAFQVKENHPQFFLFITMPPEEVDFNVHPSKKEVRFRNPLAIRDAIFKLAEPQDKKYTVAESITEWRNFEVSTLSSSQSSFFDISPLFKEEQPIKFLNLSDAIIAIERPEGILVIDYHGAHERVNFERLLKSMQENTNRFVFPYMVELNSKDYTIVRENLDLLNELGIEAQDFGKNTIIVRAVPDFIKNADIVSIIESITEVLKEEADRPDFSHIKKKIAATIACHKSLKANNIINPYEVKVLLDQLENTSDPDHCPHGRPIRKLLPLSEIRRWFSR